jgi:hypothetical protein
MAEVGRNRQFDAPRGNGFNPSDAAGQSAPVNDG